MNPVSYIKQNKEFVLKKGIYCFDEKHHTSDFEKIYLKLREKENRLYDDETLKHLPDVSKGHQHYKEWQIRKNSAEKFLKYLNSTSQGKNVLELGSGNGWLANIISDQSGTKVIGIDINNYELEQSARVFGNKINLLFLNADIFDKRLNRLIFDFIILAGTIQYFRDLSGLLARLFKLLKPEGEIHIFDSPFYKQQNFLKAKENTSNYFTQIGFPQMADFFHNHRFSDLEKFKLFILYNPVNFFNRIRRRLLNFNISPFYWFKIKNVKTAIE